MWAGPPPPWDVDVEIQVFSAGNPQLSKTLSFKPGTGQNIYIVEIRQSMYGIYT